MSWASRRRFIYITSIIAFFAVIIAIPTAIWLYEPATCFDGIQNQGETAIDRGGPCQLLDSRQLIPHAVLWARSFEVREGLYSGVAYVENPNQGAGVMAAPYRFQLYDDRNILITEREGETYIMPGAVTPVFIDEIRAGEREGERAFFEFTGPLQWERLSDRSGAIVVRNKQLANTNALPRLSAIVENTSVKDLENVTVVATVFDTAGNAFATSRTVIPLLPGGASENVVFTWNNAFTRRAARTDVLPSLPPEQ